MLIVVINLLLCNSSFPGKSVGLQFLVLINFSDEFRVHICGGLKKGAGLGREQTCLTLILSMFNS